MMKNIKRLIAVATIFTPAIRKERELEERIDRLERALREYVKKEPGIAEILKNLGLM